MTDNLDHRDLDLLRLIDERSKGMWCRAIERAACHEPVHFVVLEGDGAALPYCQRHGEIVAELNEAQAQPVADYCLDDLATGVVFLGPS